MIIDGLNHGDKTIMKSQQSVSRTAEPGDEVEINMDSSVVLFVQMFVDSRILVL